MDIHEFELRYRAYKGLNHKFNLERDQDTILNMTKISNKGTLKKPIQEIKPDELHEITEETYTNFKKDFIQSNKETTVGVANLSEYISRLEYELKVIKEMGFNSYFLIVADFVRWAKKNMIVVGPGRGSGAGSILARLTRITDIDPLQFGLLFERFLNPARISMPDFDIDFEDTQREKVIEYVQQKYGQDQVCGIGTYMQMASKAAFKDAARAIGIPFDKSNQVSGLIPDKTSILQAINAEGQNDELKNLYNSDEKIQQAADLAEKLEGNMRQLGVHACGVIIAPDKITKYSPVQYVKEGDETIISQYDGPTLETIGLLKMDFLGLRNLSVIKNCIKIIKKKYEKENIPLPDIFKSFFVDTSFSPPIDDKETFQKVFQTGNTTGIFQFESDGMRRFLIKLKADSMNDLVAMNALYRPGPMEFIPNYISRKNGEEVISYMSTELRQILVSKYSESIADQENIKLIEDLAPIMNLTYGIAVYQEQLMFLVQSMAGFSLAEADLLRRGVGKKKKEIIEKLKKEFTQRAKEFREYKKETSQYIYEKMIEPAAFYSFNKSHSVCYAMIAYQTAYLKAHFPVEFYASLIRSVEEDTDELSNYIYEAQQQGIKVLSPNINNSFNHVAAIKSEIRLGFFCIKGLGFEIGESIQEERKKNGAFKDLQDLLNRCQPVINKKSLEGLIKSGALDDFADRGTLLENVEYILERTKRSKDMSGGLFGSMSSSNNITFKKILQTSMMDKLMMEQDVFKSFVSGNPLDGLYLYLKKYNFISQFKESENFGNFFIVGYIKNIQRAKKKGFFIQIEDISGNIDFFVKDVLDFKKFDILMVSGFKGKSMNVDKIIKVSREKLVQQAGSKYNPEITVIQAKIMRLSAGPSNGNSDLKQDGTNLNIIGNNKGSQDLLKFSLPDNTQKLNDLANIINNYKGENEINIGEKTFSLNDEGVQKIKILLS
ncbi:MAG: DNA polymerase III subunit alpha [Candidatus Absconditabacterales bacterium]